MCHICRNEKDKRKDSNLNLVEQGLREDFFNLLETKGSVYMQALFDKEKK